MKRNKQVEFHPPAIVRQERARFCTEYLQKFDGIVRNWVDLAEVLLEVERDELYLELGIETWDEWALKTAPVSHRLCYAVKARFKALTEAGFLPAELKGMLPETAEWASKARNISPAALTNPEVKEALKLPKQKAVKRIQEVVPDEHVESTVELGCKFAGTQGIAIQDAYAAFVALKDEKASLEDFLEFTVSEYMDSVYQVRGEQSITVRQCWEQMQRA